MLANEDALLRWAGLTDLGRAPAQVQLREQGFDQLADACEQHLDMAAIMALLEPTVEIF